MIVNLQSLYFNLIHDKLCTGKNTIKKTRLHTLEKSPNLMVKLGHSIPKFENPVEFVLDGVLHD